MARRYFGTDGVRGRVGHWPICPEFVLRLGWAAGRVIRDQGGDRVVIGKDTRLSGYMFESALEAGFSAAGVHCDLLGPMPTPGIAYLTRTLQAGAGVVISASHNPHYDNGIKFFSADGMKLDDAAESRIEGLIDGQMDVEGPARLGRARRISDAPGRYVEFCKSTVGRGLTLQGLKLVVDCAHGATYHVAPAVFRELGADVRVLGDRPDGLNINVECGSQDPRALQAAVVESGADVGIAFDGDGDRVVMVDARGQVVDGDPLLYVIAADRHRENALEGPVVGTHMTNLGLQHALDRLGVELRRAKVGDRYVLEALRAERGVLGGESSGHIICLDRTTTGDGIVSALQVLEIMVGEGAGLAELVGPVERYPQRTVNVPIPEGSAPLEDQELQRLVADTEAVLGDAGRVLLRPSGTEPVLRVTVEGPDDAEVRRAVERLAASVGELLAAARGV